MNHDTNREHGNGFEAGLQEHYLFLECTIEALKNPTLEMLLFRDHESLEDFLNDHKEYLDGVLAKYPDRSSDWRVGFCVGFQTAHKNFLNIAGSMN